MADEQEAIAQDGQAEPATAAEQETTEHAELPETLPAPGDEPTSEGETDGGDGEPAEGEPEAIEYVTLERNGKQYQVPKELEGEFLMHSDYTKKTQSVAERVKELDAREQSITQQAEASEEDLRDRAVLIDAQERIKQYQQVDWQALETSDPLGAQTHWRIYQQLKDQVGEVSSRLTSRQNERTAKAQQDLAKRVQETLEAAPKIIPGLTPETQAATIDKLVAFATSEGIPEQVLKDNWSPTLLALLHKAQIGAQAMKKTAAIKPATPATPVLPLRTVAGKTNPAAGKSLADVAKSGDMEEYARLRAAGRAR